jgi:hypothetical protein
MTSAGRALGSAAMLEGIWTKSNFCSATFWSKRQRNILAVSNDYKTRSTTESASSPAVEHPQVGDDTGI